MKRLFAVLFALALLSVPSFASAHLISRSAKFAAKQSAMSVGKGSARALKAAAKGAKKAGAFLF